MSSITPPDNFPLMPFIAPGLYSGVLSNQMVRFGVELRDQWIWQYPDLPGAIFTYTELVKSRKWKITGPKGTVSRAVDYVHGAKCVMDDGYTEIGLSGFVGRRVMDHNCIGIKFFQWNEKGMQYLDPKSTRWNREKKVWVTNINGEEQTYTPEFVSVDKTIPIGNSGAFMSPIAFIIPTAIMAWLVKEHDNAAMDGRKIRDITVVAGEELADQIINAVEDYLKIYSGTSDPSKIGIPIVHTEYTPGVKVADLVTQIGIAKIPESFRRDDFQFKWMNQISTALGMPLRYFWNSEKATNRALEEVQEARAASRGPDAFISREQDLINQSGCLKQFGRHTRFNFIERVDIASAEINAKVLKSNIEALKMLVELSPTLQIDGETLIRWQQSLGTLPADLDIIKQVKQENSEPSSFANRDEKMIDESSDIASKSITGNFEDLIPEYGEVSVDDSGKIIERRNKVFTIERDIARVLMNDPDFIDEVEGAV